MQMPTQNDPLVLPADGAELILLAHAAGQAYETVELTAFATDVQVVEAAPGADGKPLPPRFTMLAYAGGPMSPETKPPLPHPIVVDLAGLDLARQRIPALKDHDPKHLVGHTEALTTDGKQLTAAGVVSGTGYHAKEVVETSRNGFQWQVSIGAAMRQLELVKAGQTAMVNGRAVGGPVYIARAGQLKEISFLTIGADADAAAHIAATNAATKGPAMEFAQWLAAMGLSVDALSDEQKVKLQAKFDAEKAAGNGGAAVTATTAGTGTATTTVRSPGRDLDSVIAPAREKDEQRRKIVDITARALQDNPDQIDMIEALSRQAMQGDWDTQKFELELLRATRPQSGPRFHIRGADDGLTNETIEAALCLAGGLPNPEKVYSEPTLNAASKRWKHGMGIQETLHFFARRHGHHNISSRDVHGLLKAAFQEERQIQASGVSTLSLPNILSTVANRQLRAGFEQVESTWRTISARRTVTDFRAVTSYGLTGDFTFIELAPDGQIKHGTAGEVGYSNQAKTYARMFAIDRRDIVNDDLNALSQVPRRIGRGGALKFNLVYWTTFMNNSAFWTAGNGTFLSGATAGPTDTRLNTDGLTLAETTFLGLTDPDGNPMASTPKYLLVPNGLTVTASALMRDANVMTTNANTTITTGNPHAGKFDVVRSSYLTSAAITGNSTTKWYLLADPNDVPVIEVAFLNGVETPTVEQADADFNQLGIQMRGYFDFGVSMQEYRGGVAMKGAA